MLHVERVDSRHVSGRKLDFHPLLHYPVMMNSRLHQRVRGFTLIEMMTVITIIIILAGLTVAGMGFINQKRDNAKAKVEIELISKGLEEYKSDYGQYPGLDEHSPNDGDITEEVYNALFYDGWDSQTNGDGSIEIYLPQLDPRNSKQTMVQSTSANTPPDDLKIRDPWRRPYLYRKGDEAENPDFDLWSAGKDGETDPLNPSKTVEVNGDDIRNF